MQAQQRPKPFSPFQLGDIVLVDAHLGQIIGIRYGLIAYDVTGQDHIFRNVAPERVRLASSASGERHAFQTKAERPITHFLNRLKTAPARRVTH